MFLLYIGIEHESKIFPNLFITVCGFPFKIHFNFNGRKVKIWRRESLSPFFQRLFRTEWFMFSDCLFQCCIYKASVWILLTFDCKEHSSVILIIMGNCFLIFIEIFFSKMRNSEIYSVLKWVEEVVYICETGQNYLCSCFTIFQQFYLWATNTHNIYRLYLHICQIFWPKPLYNLPFTCKS